MSLLLHDLLHHSSNLYPDKKAIIGDGRTSTYKDLLTGSSILTGEILTKLGHFDNLVAIYLPKSVEAIVAQFAVLEASMAYVPLDPKHFPANRVFGILKTANIGQLITTSKLWDDLCEEGCFQNGENSEQLTPVFVDGLMERSADEPISFPAPRKVADSDLAYVLFTSGSTGRPKGVEISHENALSFIDWAIAYFSPPPGTRFVSHASLSFDLSVFDIYVCLAVGGEIYLAPDGLYLNSRGMVRWVYENQIEYWYSVPSLWLALIKYGKVEAVHLSSLQRILFAGEAFPSRQLKALMELCPNADYYNLYGPTETNACTVEHVQSVEIDKSVSIGKACANCEVRAVNEKFESVDVGKIGELIVSGPSVAAGYYGDPDSTAHAFIDDPVIDGRRIYRTGDLARRNPDGSFEFVGRSDTLIKLSGYRIELQEIEHYLNRFVMQSAVFSISDSDEQHRLGALICYASNQDIYKPIELINRLGLFLPNYMIPEIMFKVSSLPQNQNGKVDRAKARTIFDRCFDDQSC